MIECTITKPSKTTVYDNLQSVTLPAFTGQMQILSNHAEAFIALQEGNIVLRQSDGQQAVVQITNGQCHVQNNKAVIII